VWKTPEIVAAEVTRLKIRALPDGLPLLRERAGVRASFLPTASFGLRENVSRHSSIR